eukprot:7111150-Prymnesium_polylepis.1
MCIRDSPCPIARPATPRAPCARCARRVAAPVRGLHPRLWRVQPSHPPRRDAKLPATHAACWGSPAPRSAFPHAATDTTRSGWVKPPKGSPT